MAKILKAVLFGVLIGVGIGLILSEQQQKREEKAAAEAFENDPDVKALRAEWALEKQINEVLDNMAEDEDG